MRKSVFPAIALILTSVTLATSAQASVILFADSFDRADSGDLNASTAGQSGTIGTQAYSEVIFNGAGSGASVDISSNQLSILGNGNNGFSIAYLDHNFTDASIAGSGTFTVSLDIVEQASAGNGRYLGFGIGQNTTELDGSTGVRSNSDVFIGYDDIGTTAGIQVAHNNTTESFTGFPAGTPSRPDTLSAVFTFADMNSGTALNYTVYLDGNFVANGSSAWSGTNENYISIHSSMGTTGLADNFSVTTIPEPSAALLGALGAFGLFRRSR